MSALRSAQAYTVTTAGAEGFLNLLPVYLDHILYPTLTEAAFTTEVHHVTATGQDGGVVYCEMQGRENDANSRTMLALQRAMYPGTIMVIFRSSLESFCFRFSRICVSFV